LEAIEQQNAQEVCFIEELVQVDRKTIENVPIVVCIPQIKTGKQVAIKQLGGIIVKKFV
jgi:hydrogenase maturation factor HypF (carbamoyltransferase family)